MFDSPQAAGLFDALLRRGLSRRTFLKFTAAITATLALPGELAPRVAAALTSAPLIPLVWLHGQACGGNAQAFLQSTEPTVSELLVKSLSVEYDPALAAVGSGPSTDPGYLLVVDGAIPTDGGGIFSTLGGRPIRDVLREAAAGARATIAVGSCAFDGGASAAAGGPTGAVGVGSIVGTADLVNLPGCPVNAENLAATVVHYVTFGTLPPLDSRARPYFAYGGLIHNQCERRAHFEFGEFVTAWGDEAAQKGWCLYKMGCKGPQAFANCPTQRYAGGSSWTVLAGHGCVGCTMPAFWDSMGSAYRRLPAPIAFLPDVSADDIGMLMVAGVAGLTVVHGTASYARQKLSGRREQAIEPTESAEAEEPMLPVEAAETPEIEAAEAAEPEPSEQPPEPEPPEPEPLEPPEPEPVELEPPEPPEPEPPEPPELSEPEPPEPPELERPE